MTIPILIGAFTVAAALFVVLRCSGGRHSCGGFPAAAPLAVAFPAAVILAGVASGLAKFATTAASAADQPAALAAQLPLTGAQQWLNTGPLQATDLRGKVILINFWTYSCINSLRALPYVRAWADKYKERGLVTVGAHAPEFGFEKDIANVRWATGFYDVRYPVAVDNNFAIWNGFNNEAWPAFYLIGAEGRVRLRMLGEGDYDKIERAIQQLLSETNGPPVPGDIGAITGQGIEAAADEGVLQSPETYVGYAKAENFASPDRPFLGAAKSYQGPSKLRLNHWGLAGVWNVSGEFATLNQAPGSIRFRFHARDLHFVLAPSLPDRPIRFRVKLDGASPGRDHGGDVDAEGWGHVDEPRLYQLVRQAQPVADRTFEIEFLDPGVRAYVFTFG
jgi:thiol-disulfide isomerase/thioredoxin